MDGTHTGPLSALGPQMQMAQMFIGPMLADDETRDGIRDSTADMMQAAGIVDVLISFTDREVLLSPHGLAECLISRLAAECGFTIPGYTTL